MDNRKNWDRIIEELEKHFDVTDEEFKKGLKVLFKIMSRYWKG